MLYNIISFWSHSQLIAAKKYGSIKNENKKYKLINDVYIIEIIKDGKKTDFEIKKVSNETNLFNNDQNKGKNTFHQFDKNFDK